MKSLSREYYGWRWIVQRQGSRMRFTRLCTVFYATQCRHHLSQFFTLFFITNTIGKDAVQSTQNLSERPRWVQRRVRLDPIGEEHCLFLIYNSVRKNPGTNPGQLIDGFVVLVSACGPKQRKWPAVNVSRRLELIGLHCCSKAGSLG